MLCEFCRHEFDDGLTECPYCHKKVDIEAKSLTREERDNFAGTTIEMEGSSGEERRVTPGRMIRSAVLTDRLKTTGILLALRSTGWEGDC